jgi:hypothetical protein
MKTEIKNILDRTLRASTPLAEIGTEQMSAFTNILNGIYRITFTAIRDIYYLSQFEDTGESALDLARKVIEYGITVEYMLWRGKEEMAEMLKRHAAVEWHNTFEFLKEVGFDPSVSNDVISKGVEEYETDYATLDQRTKNRKSWAGLSMEQMIEKLHSEKQLRDFDWSRIGQAYIWGCRLNHVSPIVVQSSMDTETNAAASEFFMNQAVTFGLIFHFRLSTRLLDEIRVESSSNTYEELATSIISLRDEFNQIQFSNLGELT